MENKDIRWIQRFNNYQKALKQLQEAMELMTERSLSSLEKQGVIKAFEFTHELAWKTLKDFLESKGNTNIYGSKDATREAFKLGIIIDGEIWMEMIKSRNLTSHTYDESTVDEIIKQITGFYGRAFAELKNKLNELQQKESNL